MQLLTDEQLNQLKCLSSHNIEAYNLPKDMEKHLEEVRETNKTLESRNDTLQKQVEEIQEMNKILKESSKSSSKYSKIAIFISIVSAAITIVQLCIQLKSR